MRDRAQSSLVAILLAACSDSGILPGADLVAHSRELGYPPEAQ